MKIKIITILALAFLGGCVEEQSAPINREPTRIIRGHSYSILRVDSVEFLSTGDGGLVRLGK